MIAHSNATAIDFPVDFYDLPWAAGISGTTFEELVDLFGAPTGLADPNDPGPTERWAFRYTCGLQIIYQFDLSHQQTLVIPDVPEIEHVAFHLPFPRARITLISKSDLTEQLRLALSMYPERQSEFDGLFIAQIWRQGDDGQQIPVGPPTSERAARCRVAEFESHQHKQIYWFSFK